MKGRNQVIEECKNIIKRDKERQNRAIITWENNEEAQGKEESHSQTALKSTHLSITR